MSDTENKVPDIREGIHDYSPTDRYVWPDDPILREKLEWFRDQKLAFMAHFGMYQQAGIVESWALIDEDEEWSRNEIDWTDDVDQFKDTYVNLNRSFNPVRYEPEKWAKLAKENGFRYLILTTKHHDGFCLWDTKTTDYKVTGKDCPCQRDIIKEAFDAFRKEGLGVNAYFSKADWACPYFWKPGYLHSFTSRGPSYDPSEDPETWEKFIRFTHEQLWELADQYGPLDALWFDAGWVRPSNGQDIRLDEIMGRIREKYPSVLSVARTVGGPYENYITPEQCIPDEPMDVPWESCITLGYAFSYRYADRYKSARQVLDIFLNVVAKGGNLALNIAPQPDGRLPAPAIAIVREFGSWLNAHAEGIYDTRIEAPYAKDSFFFTRNRKTGFAYAFRYFAEAPCLSDGMTLCIPYTKPVRSVYLLECGLDLPFTQDEAGIHVTVPGFEDPDVMTLTFRMK